MNFDIKSAVKNSVKFERYRKGVLYYKARDDKDNIIEFPVPIEDTGDATFEDVDKGIYFMRYIRKHLENVNGCIMRDTTTSDL